MNFFQQFKYFLSITTNLLTFSAKRLPLCVSVATDYGSKQNNVSYENCIGFYVHNNVICDHFDFILLHSIQVYIDII